MLGRPASARVAPNAWHAFGGVWRLTFRRFLIPGHIATLLVLIGLLGINVFAVVREGHAGNYSEWTLNFYVTFLLPMAAFISGATAMREELRSSTVDYVFTRPLFRPAFVLFKYVSHLVCLQLACLLAFGVVISSGVMRNIPGVSALAPSLLLAQVLLVTAFAAFGFVCAVVTARYLVLGMFYAAIVEVGLGQIPTQIGRLSLTQQVRSWLEPLMPGAPTHPAGAPPSLPLIVFVILLFTALMLATAATLVHLKQFGGAAESRES